MSSTRSDTFREFTDLHYKGIRIMIMDDGEDSRSTAIEALLAPVDATDSKAPLASMGMFSLKRRRRYRKGSHYTLSMLTRELREGHLQSLFVGSSCPVVSSNTAADPLLSSFISSGPIVDVLAKPKSDSPAEETSDKQIIDEEEAEMGAAVLPDEEQEERTRRCSFIQELLLSTIFEDTL